VVNPAAQKNRDQVFFGATVTYALGGGVRHTVTIVGVDEADADQGKVSWISPIAKAWLKARAGDTVELRNPRGAESVAVVAVAYPGK
jgi:transcription elongation factor GreB